MRGIVARSVRAGLSAIISRFIRVRLCSAASKRVRRVWQAGGFEGEEGGAVCLRSEALGSGGRAVGERGGPLTSGTEREMGGYCGGSAVMKSANVL